jgi:hypothetical protein
MTDRKCLWAVLVVLVLVFVFSGCPNPAGSNTNNTGSNGNTGNNTNAHTTITYMSLTPDGKTVELIITSPSASRAAVTLPNGSTYVLKIDGEVVSRGTVATAEDGKAVFTSEKGNTFTAEIGEDSVAILDTVIKDDGTTVTLPDLGYKNDNFHDEYSFELSPDKTVLSLNIFRRGDGTEYLPSDPRCDQWTLQDDGNRGTFPIGKWISTKNSEEFLLFTESVLTRVSPWLDTYRYDYSIEGQLLVLSSWYRVPYIPTEAEQDYIDNFQSIEAGFRQARPWIPETSTINPRATKVKLDVGGGTMLGIDFQIVDHPDMAFENDADVIGTWTVVDFVDDYDDYDDDTPQTQESDLFWSGLIFEADGVLQTKYRDGDWSTRGSWTKGILQIGNTAPEYEIKTYNSGTYIFVQWKSGDYTIRARKPSYYVFKKVS